MIAISLTSKCTLACAHCGESRNPAKPPQHELTGNEVRKILRSCARLDIKNIVFSGGEPLLREDFVSLVGYAGECGLSCGILTNGTLLNASLVRTLKATGALSFVRLSVEYPEQQLPSSGTYSFTHNTPMALRNIERCACAGIVTGVNMTLMPDNLRYLQQLADSCRLAGADYFRAVPLFPAGNAANVNMSPTFFDDCITAIVTLHSHNDWQERNSAVVRHNRTSILTRFTSGCGAGGAICTIAADGTVHFCPMVASSHPPSCREQPLEQCIASLQRRRRYLQRLICSADGSACRKCRSVDICKGGCIAEWQTRGRPASQPCCYRKTIEKLLKSSVESSKYQKTIETIATKIAMAELINGKLSCLRALPLWTVEFDRR